MKVKGHGKQYLKAFEKVPGQVLIHTLEYYGQVFNICDFNSKRIKLDKPNRQTYHNNFKETKKSFKLENLILKMQVLDQLYLINCISWFLTNCR